MSIRNLGRMAKSGGTHSGHSPLNAKINLEQLESRVVPALVFFNDSGPAAADITDTVNQFRDVVGTLNPNQIGSFGVGRREINWDGVPAARSAPNNLPADFFNVNSPRGVVFSTPGSGFQVSGSTADAGAGQPSLEFANLNPTYPTLFNAFSAQRLFTPVGSNVMEVAFFVPGTTTRATTNAFGVIFADVDQGGVIIELFDIGGASLSQTTILEPAPSGDGTFRFFGAFDNAHATPIARVRITTGNVIVGANDTGVNDVVVMDDFIFGEPIAAPAAPTIGDIGNRIVAAGEAAVPVAFAVGDANTPAGQLALSAVSSNTGLVASGNIAFGGSGANRTILVHPTAGQFGVTTITVTLTDGDGQTATDTFTFTVSPPPPADLFAVATGAGTPVQVKVFEANGTLRFTLRPFDGFTGGAAVTTADVTGDGVDDIVVGAGVGATGGHVKVFDGASGAEIRSFFAFEGFLGAVSVGTGDLTGDGLADIIVGAGAGGGPHVKAFNGATGAEIRSFFAFDTAFRGGVSVRAGDLNGDGIADIVVGTGPGAGPHIKIFDGKNQSEIASFFAGDPAVTGGVLVEVGDFVAGGGLEVLGSANGRLRVFGFTPTAGTLQPFVVRDNIVPFSLGIATAPAAIRLANGTTAIVASAAAPNAAPHVKIIDSADVAVLSFFAFDQSFLGGVHVG